MKRPEPFKDPRKPESILQDKIITKLRYYEWFVIPTHGNKFQSGMPDLVAMHQRYPWKFIEIKRRESYSYTAAQEEWFPYLKAVWVMTKISDYPVLFGPPNWSRYLKMDRLKPYTKAKTTPSIDANAMDIMSALIFADYKIMHTHGNSFQSGLPDILAVHPVHGIKWVEVKNPKSYSFTMAQRIRLEQMMICKFPVWIIQKPTEIKLLLGKSNIREFI